MKTRNAHLPQAQYWWQVMPALPIDNNCQEYFALRRVWGDHTINTSKKGRGYYWFGTEDNLTLALFQTWAITEDPNDLRTLLIACGVPVGQIRTVRWAYACEEEIEVGRYEGVSGRFLIPDIMLLLEDERGTAAVAFEVKRPGVVPTEKDLAKLKAYSRLPSLRAVDRRYACFIVGNDSVTQTKALAKEVPVLTWEELLEMQVAALSGGSSLVEGWIRRNFARYDIGDADAPPSFSEDGKAYGSASAYSSIEQTYGSARLASFIAGSECVEAFFRGENASAPAEWLNSVASRDIISARRFQTTADRRIKRWHTSWKSTIERSLP